MWYISVVNNHFKVDLWKVMLFEIPYFNIMMYVVRSVVVFQI